MQVFDRRKRELCPDSLLRPCTLRRRRSSVFRPLRQEDVGSGQLLRQLIVLSDILCLLPGQEVGQIVRPKIFFQHDRGEPLPSPWTSASPQRHSWYIGGNRSTLASNESASRARTLAVGSEIRCS